MSVAERSLVLGKSAGLALDLEFVFFASSQRGVILSGAQRSRRTCGCLSRRVIDLLIMREVEFGLIVLSAFDDGVDDVGLAALCDLLFDEGPDIFGALFGGAAGDDGSAAGRELVDHADVEIAVEGEGEGAGDGRCGHDQYIGIERVVFLHQAEALLDAEAVLAHRR